MTLLQKTWANRFSSSHWPADPSRLAPGAHFLPYCYTYPETRDMPSVIHDRNSPTPFSDDKPILAINYLNKYLGGAFWKPDDSTLTILADIQCASPIDMFDLGTHPFTNKVDFSETSNISRDHSHPVSSGGVVCECP